MIPLKVIYDEILTIGTGLLAKIKYGYNYKYNRYKFIRLRFQKQLSEQKKLYKILYKKRK